MILVYLRSKPVERLQYFEDFTKDFKSSSLTVSGKLNAAHYHVLHLQPFEKLRPFHDNLPVCKDRVDESCQTLPVVLRRHRKIPRKMDDWHAAHTWAETWRRVWGTVFSNDLFYKNISILMPTISDDFFVFCLSFACLYCLKSDI